jgi:AraC-like DNA-binding protein
LNNPDTAHPSPVIKEVCAIKEFCAAGSAVRAPSVPVASVQRVGTPRRPLPVEQDARGIVDPAQLQQVVRLSRYPAGEVLDGLVDRFWAVRWALPPGRHHDQQVLNHPGANLYVGVPEPGAGVRLEGALEGPHRRLTSRRMAGDGWTVAAMTAPGGLGAVVKVPVRTLTDRTVPLGPPVLDVDGAALVIAVEASGAEEARVAALRGALERLVHTADAGRVAAAREVAAVARAAETDRSVRRVEDLSALAGVTERTLQRMFAEHAGVTPAWVVRRYRLLEAAEQARLHGDEVNWASLAADLGYSDQAHLVRDFRTHLGTTPAAYAARQPALGGS